MKGANVYESLLHVLWDGGSTFDAWLNVAAIKIASRVLTVPQSVTQMGLPSAIVFQILQGLIGLWTQLVIGKLYLKYRMKEMLQDANSVNPSKKYAAQIHEVIGDSLGPAWRMISLLLSILILFHVSSTQLLGSGTLIYTMTKTLDKRSWTSVSSVIFSLSVLVPSAHRYRVWSFVGVITTIFSSTYLTIATLLHGKVSHLKYSSAPENFKEYFSGLAGNIFVGTTLIPVEIIDVMWKPQEFKFPAFYGIVYILPVVMLPGITMNLYFGDKLLQNSNALSLLPPSKFRDSVVILMVIHLFINFGMYSFAVYTMWEKLWGLHGSPSYTKRTLARVPVFLAFWLSSIAFPFFGIAAKLVDTGLCTWNFYIIPCVAYNLGFWSKGNQHGSQPVTKLGWAVDFSINVGIIIWVLIVEFGLGLWASFSSLLGLELELFSRCYKC